MPHPNDPRKDFVDALEYAYGPVIVSVIFSYLLATNDAVFEVLLGMTKDLKQLFSFSISSVRGLMTLLSFVFLPIILFIATNMTLETRRGFPNDVGLWAKETWNWEEALLLTFVGRLPLFGAAIGLFRAGASYEATSSDSYVMFALASVCMALVLTAFWGRRIKVYEWPRNVALDLAMGWIFLAPVVVLGLIFFPALGFYMGPVAIASLAAGFLALCTASLTKISATAPFFSRFPVVILLIGLIGAASSVRLALACAVFCVLALLYMRFRRRSAKPYTFVKIFAVICLVYALIPRLFPDCNSAAGCNLIATSLADDRPTLSQVADTWNIPSDRHLRIVAAQGGGLFAAYQTAYYLAARADLDPDFSDSVFAISGVSGGAIGAAVFWAITQDPCPLAKANCYRERVRKSLRTDYLSAPLAGLLFRDSLESMLPFSGLFNLKGLRVDRGRVLEHELERNVKAVLGTDYLGRRIGTIRQPPYLFLNSTDVHSGNSIVQGPVQIFPANHKKVIRSGPPGISLSSAAIMSARFPIITPPARYVEKRRDHWDNRKLSDNVSPNSGKPYQIVDGGYFDNSGIETAAEIVTLLSENPRFKDISIELITFDLTPEQTDFEPKGLLGAPLGAFTSSWLSRRNLTADRFFSDGRLGQVKHGDPLEPHCHHLITARNVPINTEEINFTVSWLLNDATFDLIEAEVDRAVAHPMTYPELDACKT